MKKLIGSAKKVAVVVMATVVTAPAFAEGETGAVDSILSAVDLSKVAAFIGTGGMTIIGITLAYKAVSIAKRLVSKA